VPGERIVSTYDMDLDEARVSLSLATVELKPEGSGTRLIYSEQGAFLDGYDVPAQREQGTRDPLDAWDAQLQREVLDA